MSSQPFDDFLGSLASPFDTLKKRIDAMLVRDVPIIPLRPESKDPWTKHAAYDATTDPAIIDRWIDEYDSSSNCGAVARFDGFWMLDDDLGTLAQKYKADTGQDLPSTFTVKTSRGFHYYFCHDEASRLIRYNGHDNSGVIEIPDYKGEARCNNQYVVSPGSVHPSGAIYEVYNDAPIVAAPVQLLEWLQKAYAQSEALKDKSKTPRPNRNADPGFRKLFDAVGYRPLVSRINALADVRLHIKNGLKRGKTVPCPMPQHKHKDYTDCFGAMQDAPELLHCLGNCHWTGDMVAACYEIDGGKKKYNTMYDCARAICKQESLNFDDFSPAKSVNPTSIEINSREVKVPAIEERPDMPRTVLVGRLGEICEQNMLADFPVSYAWLALVTAASVLVPEREVIHAGGDNLHNLYTALVGPVNCGKSQAIEWAMKLLRIQDDPKQFSEVKAGSAERLLKYMNRLQDKGQLGPRVLMFLDEWKFFFDKAGIENSVFPTLLTTGFYRRNTTILDSHGHPLNVPASFSWIGGIVTDSYDDCLSHVTSLGLHDRLLQGINPIFSPDVGER